jgi:HAD superfamily hydrolase (TIGR01509 family)
MTKKQSNIDWIFFDVGGVLFDDSFCEQWRLRALQDVIRRYGPDITEQDIISVFPKASAAPGTLDRNIIACFLANRKQADAAGAEITARRKQETNYYQQAKVRPEAMETVRILSADYKLGLLANQSVKAREKFKEFGILPYFTHTGVSADYRLIKPDPRLWLEIFKETGANPRRSAVVDDNIERGLAPAKKFGMFTVWYKLRERGNIPIGVVDYTITSLTDLLDIF